ncbi:MAG: carbamoyltransferase HypF, partial [Desulfotignum sp.]
MNSRCIASRLDISGVVQGVGFRPFLFALAQKHAINGEVSNTAGGVLARVEGTSASLDEFVHEITANPPVLARVDEIRATPVPVTGFTDFHILPSRASESRATLISPDVCVCADCLKEMRDPGDRRFGYPFINCTNCGPRFTIINDIPYDRPNTSMKDFVMCPDCRAEYENPADRRFHAQPNACPVCGPHVVLTDNQGRQAAGPDNALAMAADLLKKGHILAVKGLGGFHLAADAANDRAVQLLRQRKHRPHKPFALMAGSVSVLGDHVQMSEVEKNLLQSYHRPIVLADKHLQQSCAALSPALAPNNTCLGIMLPYTPLHYLIFDTGPDILVMTSGNRSGEPLSVDNQDALEAFSHIADYFLLHNRDIYFRADDSIVRFQAQKPRFIRRSRGYAPLPVQLHSSLPSVLGCGAGLKNTICLTRGNQAFLSQHIGDMENLKTSEFYARTIDHFAKILDITPLAVAHDLHPGYMSTVFAEQYAAGNTLEIRGKTVANRDIPAFGVGTGNRIPLVGVQHHHAHAVSCMAENHLDEPVIAITLDGTGYGTDGRIWGGEILAATCETFQRKAHLTYVPMPGGDAAVLEPWRMAAAVLYTAMGKTFLDLDIPYIRQMDREKLAFVCQMMEKQINCPKTSSCGRLFDAAASLLCIRHTISHESQAAMELEAKALENTGSKSADPYAFGLDRAMPGTDGPAYTIDMMPCVRDMVADITEQVPTPVISRRFHQTIVAAFAEAAQKTACAEGLDKVVLSGGVFHNDIILTKMIQALEEKDLAVFTHSLVPTGDGGISLG